MPTKQLTIKTETDMFGTNVYLTSKDGTQNFMIGERISYAPLKKLKKNLKTGYLFRSPNLDPTNLSEIWDTVEGFTGDSSLKVEFDDKTEMSTAYMRVAEKGDATMFAFSHSMFEKWSDEKTVETKKAAKKKKPKVFVDKDGNLKVKVQVESLDSPDPE